MTVKNPRSFFKLCVNVLSSILPDEDNKLTYKEKMFLIECCMYNYRNNDLSNTSELSDHMKEIGFFSRKTDTSIYKYKLSLKKWAITGRDQFTLPGVLAKKEGDKLSLDIKISLDEVSD